MKKIRKRVPKARRAKITKYNKGALGAGMAYAVVGFFVIISAAGMMLGSVFPSAKAPKGGQTVVIVSETPQRGKDNLQLYTFPGATYTPTPSPTDTPTPTPPPKPPDSGGGGGGGGGGNTCFPKGTKILMANNQEKNIEDVKIGDKVMGYDTVLKKQTEETVQELESPIRDHLYQLTFTDGTTVSLTREHPLYTTKGWASIDPASTYEENNTLHVAQMSLGDAVLNDHNHYVTIAAITYIPGNVQTYNLKRVTGNNDFYADSYLAHNKGGSGGGSGGGGGGGTAL